MKPIYTALPLAFILSGATICGSSPAQDLPNGATAKVPAQVATQVPYQGQNQNQNQSQNQSLPQGQAQAESQPESHPESLALGKSATSSAESAPQAPVREIETPPAVHSPADLAQLKREHLRAKKAGDTANDPYNSNRSDALNKAQLSKTQAMGTGPALPGTIDEDAATAPISQPGGAVPIRQTEKPDPTGASPPTPSETAPGQGTVSPGPTQPKP